MTPERKAEVARLYVQIDRAEGALVDAGTVCTSNLEEGIRTLTAQRDKAETVVRVAEAQHQNCPYEDDVVPRCGMCAALAAFRGRA